MSRRVFLIIIREEWSLPYHSYRISHQNFFSQILSKLQVKYHCNIWYIILHHKLYYTTWQKIKILPKKINIFMGDHNKQKMMTSNETRLTISIADLIISEVISFNLAQKPRFKDALDLAKNVSKFYRDHGKKLEFDYERVWYFWIVISRWRCHYFQDSTIENIGIGGNISVALFELVYWQGHWHMVGKNMEPLYALDLSST